jgi:hypothetical protein
VPSNSNQISNQYPFSHKAFVHWSCLAIERREQASGAIDISNMNTRF